MLLPKLPVEILLSRRCDLKKKVAKKRSLKILFSLFYTFPESKKLKWCFGAECFGNFVIEIAK